MITRFDIMCLFEDSLNKLLTPSNLSWSLSTWSHTLSKYHDDYKVLQYVLEKKIYYALKKNISNNYFQSDFIQKQLMMHIIQVLFSYYSPNNFIGMDEKIHTEVELSFVGEPPAVKELSGVLVTSRSTIEIECLPKDLVSKLEVDLSVLKSFDDSIHVSDIKVPAGITVLTVPEDMVVLVQAPRIEEAAIQSKAEIDAKEEQAVKDGEEDSEDKNESDKPNEEKKDK